MIANDCNGKLQLTLSSPIVPLLELVLRVTIDVFYISYILYHSLVTYNLLHGVKMAGPALPSSFCLILVGART